MPAITLTDEQAAALRYGIPAPAGEPDPEQTEAF